MHFNVVEDKEKIPEGEKQKKEIGPVSTKLQVEELKILKVEWFSGLKSRVKIRKHQSLF